MTLSYVPELAKLATDLEGLYGAGKACDESGENCQTLPELENILAASRDYDEQLMAWQAWREVSPPMRPHVSAFCRVGESGGSRAGLCGFGRAVEGWLRSIRCRI